MRKKRKRERGLLYLLRLLEKRKKRKTREVITCSRVRDAGESERTPEADRRDRGGGGGSLEDIPH